MQREFFGVLTDGSLFIIHKSSDLNTTLGSCLNTENLNPITRRSEQRNSEDE